MISRSLFIAILLILSICNSASIWNQPQDLKGKVVDMSTGILSYYDIEDHDLYSLGLDGQESDISEELSHSLSVGSEIKRGKDINDQTLYIMKSVDEMKKFFRSDLMKNKKNMFFFKNSKSSIYYDENETEWFEYKLNNSTPTSVNLKTFPNLIPVTQCFDSGSGDGGSITRTYEVGVHVGDTISGSLNLRLNIPLIISTVLGTSVAPSYKYSGHYTCNVGKGQYGQLFIEPFYVEVPESSRRKVAYDKHKGIVAKGESYEEFEKFKLIAKHKPNHYCIITNNISELKCDSKIGDEKFSYYS